MRVVSRRQDLDLEEIARVIARAVKRIRIERVMALSRAIVLVPPGLRQQVAPRNQSIVATLMLREV